MLLVSTSGCPVPTIDLSEEAAAAVRQQDLGDLPYHPFVFHLDLSILTYHLYGQSLIWPFDPYYEELDNLSWDRTTFMDRVRGWAATTGGEQAGAGLDAFRGPGILSGFDDATTHDPLIYQYSRIDPWTPTITNAIAQWTEYLTPAEVTDTVRDVYVCTRTAGRPEGEVTVDALVLDSPSAAPGARDVLLAFEGGTGDKGEGEPPSQSLMGFALVRAGEGDAYDVHIAFRGSRSGSGARAALQALSTEESHGNPDWITDLGYREVSAPFVSTEGLVSRGMSRAIQTIFPQVFGCLDEVVGAARPAPPRNVYVTGHSLGAALAQHFSSAVLMGDEYGPSGDAMPSSLQDWPWERLKLITYGAPRVGDEDWARTLTEDRLGARFFVDTQQSAYDQDAIGFLEPEILPRLLDVDAAAAYRVLLPTDFITTDAIAGGSHVGTSVYLVQPTSEEAAAVDLDAHEPRNERAAMVTVFDDPRIPPDAWEYHELEWLVPDRDADAAGTAAEYRKLAAGTLDYYRDRGLPFDEAAFDASLDTFLELLSEL